MINIFKRKRKPKFYKAVLQPVSNVMKFCYPDKAVRKHMTLDERLPDNGCCPECSENVWWLLPNFSVVVRTGGKPYIECMNCGFQTHL
jgi:predicted RNA-binding Zn-ribbon protein involved in translation (DUF1610 family)